MASLIEQMRHEPASALQCEPAFRALAIASGALLMFLALKKQSMFRLTAAAAGGAMIYWGATASDAPVCPVRVGARKAATEQTIEQSITISRSPAEVFALWLNHDVVSRVMYPFGYMQSLGPDHVRSTIELPVGKIELEALLVEARPDELVHWRTVSDSLVQVDERMRFSAAPQGLGTAATLHYEIDFSKVPAGAMLRAISGFFERVPQEMLRRVLENFKSIAETGEIAAL